MDDATPRDADPDALRAWGIEPGYHDVHGDWHAPSAEAARRIRQAMGATTDDPNERPPQRVPLAIIRPGDTPNVAPGTVLAMEDGTELDLHGSIPPDLALGYHRLISDGDEPVTRNLIVAPPRCAPMPATQTWGITAQLYAARSTRSWGIGDLADLETLIDWAADRGAGVIGLNPLHAPDPTPQQPNSPYSPSSRRWRDPLYLAIEAVPGAADLDDLDDLAARGQALNAGARIDRTAIWARKRATLTHLWSRFGKDQSFEQYRAEMGADLTAWAVHCVLTEHHGEDWRLWPSALRRADPAAIAEVAAERAYEVGFWSWLQWLMDRQLAASGAPDTVVTDLAVGFSESGFDAWQWQDLVASDTHIGAPPDLLGPDGQDWGLPPFIPSRLRDQAYQPFARTIRSVARHSRGLRIDHVMGLFRLLWVPPGMTAAEGAYVRFPGRELLDIVALESARADTFVVGEDLGTVAPGVREILGDAGVLSTRLLWFEDGPPEHWPTQAMAAITTHDLPTVAGVWSGVDLADQRAAGVTVPANGDEDFRHRLRVAAGVDDEASIDDVAVGAHVALSRSPSALITAALDDLVGAEHRPNLPGTIDENPNWRIPLPVPLDHLDGHGRAEAIAATLDDATR